MSFTQIIEIETDDIEAIERHVSNWHRSQSGIAPGYRRSRILADGVQPGTYLIEVEFSSEQDAAENDQRPETNEWARNIRSLLKKKPSYRNLTEVRRTEGS